MRMRTAVIAGSDRKPEAEIENVKRQTESKT